MIVQEVAKKYANALFLATRDRALLDTTHEQMSNLGELLRRDRSFIVFLTAPNVADENKIELVRRVFSDRVERIVVEFLLVLVDKGRIGYLPEIIDEYIRLYEAESGLGRVTVVTAVPLDDSQRERLRQRLAAKTELKIVLEEKVDPGVIGGAITILHNEIIDGSIRHGLDLIEHELDQVRVH